MRVREIVASIGLASVLSLCAGSARAEYVVLRSGARLNVTSYELLGDKYRLQMVGGVAEVPAAGYWASSRKMCSTLCPSR